MDFMKRRYIYIRHCGIYHMYPDGLTEYISQIQANYKKKPELDYILLDILEQFAWDRSISAYDVHKRLSSPSDRYYRRMAYKNVNKRVHELFSLGLIERTSSGKKVNKRKTKYYQLTEYGIFRLLLNRLSSVVVNQFDLRKSQEISTNMLTFFNNYQISTLFKLFIYPNFEKRTLFTIWNYLFFDLYGYLGECCRRIESRLKTGGIPIGETMFSIEKDMSLAEDDRESLSHYLRKMFKIQDVLSIEPSNDSTQVTIYAANTKILLDKNKKETTVISTANSKYEEFRYGLYPLGPKFFVIRKETSEESHDDMYDSLKNEMEEIIYGLVYTLASEDPRHSTELNYYSKSLAEDKKFMDTVERIYRNRHARFERGYNILRSIS